MSIIKKMCYIAVFSALFIILDYISIFIPGINLNITLKNLPLFIGAIILGPIGGVLIAFIGMFIRQLRFQIDLMTIIWMCPQIIVGFLTGLLSSHKIINYNQNIKFSSVIIILLHLLLTIINTLCLFIKGLYYGENLTLIKIETLASFPIRIITSFITAIIYIILIPIILKAIQKLDFKNS